MDFNEPNDMLEMLLCSDKSYEELLEFCEKLYPNIKVPHKNSLGNEYHSKYTQCILECYKQKYNFSSNVWYSTKAITLNSIKTNSAPIEFSRLGAKGEIIKYVLYNENQIDENNFKNKVVAFDEIKFEENKQKNYSIKKEILACVQNFNSKYGKSGIAKILKGSKGLKDSDYNQEALNSIYYGILSEKTLAFIEKEIDNLIDDNYLEIKKINFARPILLISDKGENYLKSIEKDEIQEQKTDEFYNDETFIKITNEIDKGSNIFITGHAGTGKSFILNKLKKKYKDLVITSTTGIAAVNIKGQTLHSWAGVGICNHSLEHIVGKILHNNSKKQQIQKCKMLAIDEISMLNIATFEYVDKVLRLVRGSREAFGGIQLILIGDFFQLPPVEENSKNERKYCFESTVWHELQLKNIILTHNYRQHEKDLIQALSNMRVNNLSKKDIELLKTREITKEPDDKNMLHIYSTNEEADNYNNKMFKAINSKEIVLTSIDGICKGAKLIEIPRNDREKNILNRIDIICRAEKNIILKIGARVMLLVNLDFEKGLINGSCGIVEDICEDFVSVKFDNGVKSKIKQHDFEFYNNNELIALRKQYPLRLAYGITIHKSQGMSLDNLVVDCSRIFEKGQAYVALSRIKKLSGLYLYNFSPNNVMVDEKVVEFYKNLK